MTPPPRSVADATRFTSTMPHATHRAGPGSSANPTASRFQSPGAAAATGSSGGPGGSPAASPAETPAQKVARLRAAHLAAKNAKVSGLDRLVDAARGLFDSAHRVTIIGLIGFTAVAGVVTAYTTIDMLRFNRRRKAEFIAAQKQMEADGLAAARLAFMRGDATPEQEAMVDEAAAAGAPAPRAGDGFFSIPSLLGAPKPLAAETETATGATGANNGVAAAASASWARQMLAREEQGEAPGSSQSRLGYESLSDEDEEGVRESDVVRAIEEHRAYLAAKAQAAASRSPDAAAPSKSWWKFW